MEQHRQAFIEVNIQKGTVGSLRLLSKMQQPAELQLNNFKQPRKLLLRIGLISSLLLACYFYDVYFLSIWFHRLAKLLYHKRKSRKVFTSSIFSSHSLRADARNYGESGVSREISNFFIFWLSNLYSKLFSKLTLKVSTAFHFFQNRAKFENKAYRPPSNSEIDEK